MSQLILLIEFVIKIKLKFQTTNIQRGKIIPTYGILWYFFKKENVEINNKIVTNIIVQADTLFEDGKYFEAYNLLASYNKEKCSDIDWRICRALYKMSKTDDYNPKIKQAMIFTAYNLINKSMEDNQTKAETHKWMAILLDAKLQFETKLSNIEDKFRIKRHLMEANRLNPNDFVVLYMLGQWHYKLCALTWLQKRIATFLYNELPVYDYQDALIYFSKAEELKPRYYLENIYMLGQVHYQLGNMYKAQYYFTIAADMTPNTSKEEYYVNSARNLGTNLKNYDVSEEAL